MLIATAPEVPGCHLEGVAHSARCYIALSCWADHIASRA